MADHFRLVNCYKLFGCDGKYDGYDRYRLCENYGMCLVKGLQALPMDMIYEVLVFGDSDFLVGYICT